MRLRRKSGVALLGTILTAGLWLGAGCHPPSARSGDAVVDVGSGQPGESSAKQAVGACSPSGYCWESPVPVGGFFTGLWGSGPNDVYAVSPGGQILHFDGTSWQVQRNDPDESLYGVWGSGPEDVLVVGDAGRILRRKGGVWTAMEADNTADLQAVWGAGPNDVYAVGTHGAVLHFDGQQWSREDSGADAFLQAIWGSGGHDIYAVGAQSRSDQGVVLHYDGASWTQQSVGKSLCCVWGAGPDAVWVAGADERDKLAMWKLSSEEWTPVRVPKAGKATALSGVGGKPVLLGSVSLSGEGDYELFSDVVFALEEKDGLFQRRDLLTTARAIIEQRWAIWGAGPGSAFVAGWWGVAGKLDAGGLHSQTGNAALGKNFTAVWGTSPKDVVAVGIGGTMAHYDGKAWSPDPAGKTHDFTAIHGSKDTLVAAGKQGVLLARRKGVWKSLATSTSAHLSSVWTSGDEIFAAGEGGTVVHCAGETCAPMPTGTKKDLWGIMGRSPTEVYVAGENDTFLRWDGTSWKLQAVPLGDAIFAIGSDGQGGLMAVSVGATWVLRDGAWKRVTDSGGWALTDNGAGEVRAVYGGGGLPYSVRRWTGKSWQEESLPVTPTDISAGRLTGIWSSGEEVFVVGAGGTILHRKP